MGENKKRNKEGHLQSDAQLGNTQCGYKLHQVSSGWALDTHRSYYTHKAAGKTLS